MGTGETAIDERTDGLTGAEVAERVARGETNAFESPTSRSAWSIVKANVFTLFNGIIAACFVVLLLIGRWQDALFGFSAIANTIIGSWQEFNAKRALDRLALLHAPSARVRRDGRELDVPLADVVLDDRLVLRAGDQVPADARVVASERLQLDESMLTGESDPVDKQPGDEVLSGSIVIGGAGGAVVDRVGADAFANKLSSEAKQFSLVASELRSSLNRLLGWIAWIIGPVSLLVLNAQMVAAGGWAEAIEGGTWDDAVVATVAAIVAMIPLGLVLMTSIAFAVGAVRLASRKVLVQELPAVEGLARVDLICLDKTGTLTEGDIVFDAAHPVALDPPEGWTDVLAWYGADPEANATARCLVEPYPVRQALEPQARVAFASSRKWSAVGFPGGGTWVLGGPEMVFPATDAAGEADAAGEPGTDGLRARAAELAATGRRTLVLAHSPEELTAERAAAERLPRSLAPVVLLTFRENVRGDARETLEYFAEQGVAVRIISGDNPQTVAAIAREVGVDAPHGIDARTLPDDLDELGDLLEREVVFGRVTPTQKRDIVTALRRRGHTVAMTGDGVNDALAIKEADIGIAMESGSSATKAVARLVLLDGRFSHLPGVVAEGRRVAANIERVSMLFLTKTAYATGLAVLFGVMLLPFPFLPRQLSVTDALTIGFPAFFLALMPNARRYVPGFLRRSLSFAIPAGVVIALVLALYSRMATDAGIPEDELRSGSTLILGIVGLWVLTVLSRPIDGWKIVIIGGMAIGLIAIYAIPLAADFLELVELSETTAVLALAASLVAIAGIEVVRFVHRRAVARMTPTVPAALVATVRRTAPGVPSDPPGRTGPRDRSTARG
ncbi:magnesium-transporting ATPase [Agromyces luteolus]|uniref:HAD-IC family P-type ATPase n=1 Tax=Agromyces luteolus TaxID=88373 RepID=UPI0022F3185F|nr:HAD-IC family P-type ATPase [Agromyces luteolus]GLK26373.1 magnesium-transporting ATPase [Agromyces luteolus]